MMVDWQKQGRRNKSRGDAFEKLCAGRPEALGLTLILKRIDRIHRRGVSLSDIEIVDFPNIKVDCKFTEGEYTFKEKTQLLEETIRKYGRCPNDCIVVIGEKKDKAQFRMESAAVLFQGICGLTMIQYDSYLRTLESVKQLRFQ